jgi:hypothetical protein
VIEGAYAQPDRSFSADRLVLPVAKQTHHFQGQFHERVKPSNRESLLDSAGLANPGRTNFLLDLMQTVCSDGFSRNTPDYAAWRHYE